MKNITVHFYDDVESHFYDDVERPQLVVEGEDIDNDYWIKNLFLSEKPVYFSVEDIHDSKAYDCVTGFIGGEEFRFKGDTCRMYCKIIVSIASINKKFETIVKNVYYSFDGIVDGRYNVVTGKMNHRMVLTEKTSKIFK